MTRTGDRLTDFESRAHGKLSSVLADETCTASVRHCFAARTASRDDDSRHSSSAISARSLELCRESTVDHTLDGYCTSLPTTNYRSTINCHDYHVSPKIIEHDRFLSIDMYNFEIYNWKLTDNMHYE